MKFFLLAVCFVAAFRDAATTSKVIGCSLLYENSIVKPGLEPEDIVYSGEQNITGYVIKDMLQGKGAYWSVVTGGVGFNSVNIRFTPTGADGIDSKIYILGRDSKILVAQK